MFTSDDVVLQVVCDTPEATLAIADLPPAHTSESQRAFGVHMLATALKTTKCESSYYVEAAGGDLRAAADLLSALSSLANTNWWMQAYMTVSGQVLHAYQQQCIGTLRLCNRKLHFHFQRRHAKGLCFST